MRTIKSLLLSTTILLAVGASPGCGSGSGGIVSSALTASCPPMGALDGFVDDSGFVDSTGASGGILVGDNMVNHVAQGFLTFDISVLPAGAEILSATLEVRHIDVSGSPYAGLGVVWLDHVELGGTLDATDWGVLALDGNFAVLSTDPSLGARGVDVTAQVAADGFAGRAQSSFRLGFTALTDGDNASDYVTFQDAEDSEGSGVLPTLTVRFRP